MNISGKTLARSGAGRPKGAPNKTTKAVKEMILAALDKVGGEKYLVKQASENPVAFMTLIGKVLPTQLTGADGESIQPIINVNFVKPK